MSENIFWAIWAVFMAVGAVDILWAPVYDWFRDRFHRDGCCSTCGGTGSDASAYETNGLCWDCRGTGHAHYMRWPNR